MNSTLLLINENLADNITKGSAGDAEAPDTYRLSPEQRDFLVNTVYFWIRGVVSATICSIGIFANLLNIVTLWRQKHLVTYKLFLGMAVADLVVVTVILSYSLSYGVYRPLRTTVMGKPPNMKIPYPYYAWFHIHSHVQNTFMCISNWCVVLVALFRLIVISFPLKATEYASNFRVHLSLALVYIGSLIVMVPSFLTQKWVEYGRVDKIKSMGKYGMISVVFTIPIPVLLCAVCTIALIIQLGRQQARMKGSLREEQMAERQRDHRQLTITLLLILIFFLVTNLPDMIYWMMSLSNEFKRRNISQYDQQVYYLTGVVLTATNYSGNFFIYIVSNSSFRKDLMYLVNKCKCSRNSKDKNNSASRSTAATSMASSSQEKESLNVQK